MAKPELALGRVVARSFSQWHPEIPFFLLLADELQDWAPSPTDEFELLELAELRVPRIERLCFGYDRLPLSYACTPFLLSHLLDRGYSTVLFYKQESLVLGDQGAVLDRLGAGSILLTPHLHAPLEGPDAEDRELNILLSGQFNAGLLGVRDTPPARRFLSWWSDRLRRHCRHDVAHGMHYEQRWLDLVPSLFEGVEIMRHPGANAGHWSLPQHEVAVDGSAVLIDGQPCRLFRFSGYDLYQPEAMTRHSSRLSKSNIGAAALVLERYGRALREAGQDRARSLPYAFSRFDNGVSIPAVVRAAYLDLQDQQRFGNPFATSGSDSLWGWLNEPLDCDTPALTRLWQLVWSARVDLRSAFPDYLRHDRAAYLAWTASAGPLEHGIPIELAAGADRS